MISFNANYLGGGGALMLGWPCVAHPCTYTSSYFSNTRFNIFPDIKTNENKALWQWIAQQAPKVHLLKIDVIMWGLWGPDLSNFYCCKCKFITFDGVCKLFMSLFLEVLKHSWKIVYTHSPITMLAFVDNEKTTKSAEFLWREQVGLQCCIQC